MIFVTSADWPKVAKTLDTAVLAMQIIDVCNILDELHQVENRKVEYHLRLAELWRHFEPQLAELGLACTEELEIRRGSESLDGIRGKIMWHLICATSGKYSMDKPVWAEDDRVHLSHRAALYNLNPDHYLPIWGVREFIPIFWPDVA